MPAAKRAGRLIKPPPPAIESMNPATKAEIQRKIMVNNII